MQPRGKTVGQTFVVGLAFHFFSSRDIFAIVGVVFVVGLAFQRG